MKRADCGLRAAALCLGALALAPHALSAGLMLPRDGWASWEVPAIDAAPDWCCWSSWRDRDPSRRSCRLDSGRDGYGARGDATTETVRVYARMAGGKVDRLRVLSATCPVEAATPIRDLGSAAMDDSARWLIELAKHARSEAMLRRRVGDDVLAALAITRGDLARNALAAVARNDAHVESRKQALFWLAALRGQEGAESVIFAALKEDADEDVREHAVFALSRLPDERATRALIATAEDQSLSREHRKRAVFWLAQSESAAAERYLDKVLAGSELNDVPQH